MKHLAAITLGAAMCLSLAACQSTAVRAPAPPMPTQWATPVPAATALQVNRTQQWWLAFDDATLTQLIDQALLRNGELASAMWRVRSAQLRIGTAQQALLPMPSGAISSSASQAPNSAENPSPRWQQSHSASLGVSWELDIWGRLRDARDAAALEAHASQADRDAVALSISGQVARQYWQIAAMQARIERADTGLALAERTLRMTRAQYQAGAISGLDLAQAEQSLQSQQTARLALQQQLDEARNTFSLLFDLPPAQLPAGLQVDSTRAQAASIPTFATGTPADVLLNRPDLRAANQRLEAVALNIDITRKSFFPGISLSAGVGSGGSSISQLLSNPSKTLGVGVSLPFLNIAELRRQPQIAQNDYEIAVLAYRQSIYRALAEVENALTALHSQQQQVQQQEQALSTARRIERMNEVRYRAGSQPLRLWLDAQESLRQTELALIDARFAALQAAADLYLALGGALE